MVLTAEEVDAREKETETKGRVLQPFVLLGAKKKKKNNKKKKTKLETLEKVETSRSNRLPTRLLSTSSTTTDGPGMQSIKH